MTSQNLQTLRLRSDSIAHLNEGQVELLIRSTPLSRLVLPELHQDIKLILSADVYQLPFGFDPEDRSRFKIEQLPASDIEYADAAIIDTWPHIYWLKSMHERQLVTVQDYTHDESHRWEKLSGLRIGGWPLEIQSIMMQWECEYASAGLNTGGGLQVIGIDWEQNLDEVLKWKLILQYPAGGNHTFLDDGCVYLWGKSDGEKFINYWVVSQST
ncbi:MAG: hypothetical protein RL095_720 [Verrucomicrobiota bacterium]|jgi:hypothetical protein